MSTITIAGISISAWIYMPIIYFFWVSFWLMVKKIAVNVIRKITSRTPTHLDDIILKAANFPITLLIFASGAAIIEQAMPRDASQPLTQYFVLLLKAATVVAAVLFCDKFVSSLIKEYSPRIEILKTTGGVARGFVRFLVIGLGVLILLDSFGISITPLIASLGIGSLAVALALQPTLENLFSGVQIVTDKPILVGQFVKLESGEEGYVHKIGWRSTWIRTLPNNIVVIPNKVLVNSRIINYYYPDKELAVTLEMGVHYGSDLEKVERVTIEVAKAILKQTPGGVASFEPFIRYHTFSDFSINFTVVLRGHEFVDQHLLKHEFIKHLHKRYNEEGIVIPYPVQAVNFAQEKQFEHPQVHS